MGNSLLLQMSLLSSLNAKAKACLNVVIIFRNNYYAIDDGNGDVASHGFTSCLLKLHSDRCRVEEWDEASGDPLKALSEVKVGVHPGHMQTCLLLLGSTCMVVTAVSPSPKLLHGAAQELLSMCNVAITHMPSPSDSYLSSN